MGLFETAFDAVKWGLTTNFRHIGRWLLLTVLSIIPIANILSSGALLKVLTGEEPEIEPAGRTFLNGLLWLVISIIYMIIPVIIAAVSLILLLNNGASAGAALGIAGIIISIILAVIISLIMIPAMIHFARTGKFAKGFAFGEIFGMISNVGRGRYILAFIVMIIFAVLVGIVLGGISFLLTLIPVAGIVLASIFGLLTLIPLICWVFKYWNNVFA